MPPVLAFARTLAPSAFALTPLLARLLRIDPAIMSGPFITTVVDVCGLIVYFETAQLFLGRMTL